ncbi:hypothetical protein MRX96_029812 [Rhipicephalus microplus]
MWHDAGSVRRRAASPKPVGLSEGALPISRNLNRTRPQPRTDVPLEGCAITSFSLPPPYIAREVVGVTQITVQCRVRVVSIEWSYTLRTAALRLGTAGVRVILGNALRTGLLIYDSSSPSLKPCCKECALPRGSECGTVFKRK